MQRKKDILLLATGVASNIGGIYVVGAATDEWLNEHPATLATILFTTAIILLVTHNPITPNTKKCFNPVFSSIFEVLAINFYISLALRLVWLPLIQALHNSHVALNQFACQFKIFKQPPLSKGLEVLKSDQLIIAEETLLSMLFLHWVMEATGAWDQLKTLLKKFKAKLRPAPAPCPPPAQEVPSAGGAGDQPNELAQESDEEPPVAPPRRRKNSRRNS